MLSFVLATALSFAASPDAPQVEPATSSHVPATTPPPTSPRVRRIRPVTPGIVVASAGLALAGSGVSAALGLSGPPYIAERWAYTAIPLTALGAGLPVFLGSSGGLATSFGAPVTGYIAGGFAGLLVGAPIGMAVSELQGESFAYGMVGGGLIGIALGGAAGATLGACLATSADLARRRRSVSWMPQFTVYPDGGGVAVSGRW